MKPSPKKKQKAKATKSKDRLREYYDSLDLRTWWEAFIGDCNENGTPRYPTVWSFISAKAKDKWKRDFLWWILGPIGSSEEYKGYDQFDWEAKKEKGFWYNTTNASKLQSEVKAHANALDSLREVGKVNVKFISRLENLANEIDREYSGRLFLPNLTQKENTLRANTYTRLLNELYSMMEKAQIMFGRTQGMDLERLDHFFAMFGKGMGTAAANIGLTSAKTIEGEVTEVNAASTAMTLIANMMAKKAASYEIDLPDPEMNDIITKTMKPSLLVAQKG